MEAEMNNDKVHIYGAQCNETDYIYPNHSLLPNRETKTITFEKLYVCNVGAELKSNNFLMHDHCYQANLQSRSITDEEANIHDIESEISTDNLHIYKDNYNKPNYICMDQSQPLPNIEPNTLTDEKSSISHLFTEMIRELELPAYSSSSCTASKITSTDFKADQAICSARPFSSYSTRTCKFPSCNNRYFWRSNLNRRFHRFPRNSLQRELWHIACYMELNANSKNFYVCEDHFDDSDYIGGGKNRMLKRRAVPKNLNTDSCQSNSLSNTVSERLLEADGTNNYTSSPTMRESLIHEIEFPEQSLCLLNEVSKCQSNVDEKTTVSCPSTEKMNFESEFLENSSICTAYKNASTYSKVDQGISSPGASSGYSTRNCKFPSCNNRYFWKSKINVKFHRFPSDCVQRPMWHLACNIDENVNSKNFYVCEDHFDDSDYIEKGKKGRLLSRVVPKNTNKCQSNRVPQRGLQTDDANININYIFHTSSSSVTERLYYETEFPEQSIFLLNEYFKHRSNYFNADGSSNSDVLPSLYERIICDSGSIRQFELLKSYDNCSPNKNIEDSLDKYSPRYPTRTCKFPSCENKFFWMRSKNKKFHRFPQKSLDDSFQRQLWHTLCGIPLEVNTRNYFICEDHFDDSDYNQGVKKGRLRHDAIPKEMKSMVYSLKHDHSYYLTLK